MVNWQLSLFSQLTTHQLYVLLKLRTDVFVVEQECPYPELDNKDLLDDVYHLLGYRGDTLSMYARLLPPGTSYDEVSIGRVVVCSESRGVGAGHQLMTKALQACDNLWPETNIKIGAQVYLESFYRQYGFVSVSEDYLEDGIPHVDMLLTRVDSAAR